MKLEIIKNIDTFGGEIKPGQAFWSIYHSGNLIKPNLYVCCPKCGKSASTVNHKYTITENGTVTIEPSLQCPISPCTAHYWIKNGEFTGI